MVQPSGPLIHKKVCEKLIGQFYKRKAQGEKVPVLLNEMLNEVYARGHAAGVIHATKEKEK